MKLYLKFKVMAKVVKKWLTQNSKDIEMIEKWSLFDNIGG